MCTIDTQTHKYTPLAHTIAIIRMNDRCDEKKNKIIQKETQCGAVVEEETEKEEKAREKENCEILKQVFISLNQSDAELSGRQCYKTRDQ